MKKREAYIMILKSLQIVKREIMNELADELPFGIQNKNTMEELENVADISGNIMTKLKEQGETLSPVDGRPQFVEMELDGEKFLSHISKIGGKITQTEHPVSSMPARENAPVKVQEIVENPSETKEETPKDFSQDALAAEKPNVTSTEREFYSTAEEKRDVPETYDEITDSQKNMVAETGNQDDTEGLSVEENTSESENGEIQNSYMENEPEEEIIEENPIQKQKDSKQPVFSSMNSIDIFKEEKEKNSKDFVYDIRRITVCHMGSSPEEMQFFIAPLKIYKYSCVSAPIIVSVYYRGNFYTASSYDKAEDGRNMVAIEVNEYYFLCRGFFNDNGEFQSMINTTGISANQGDRIKIVNEENHHPTGPNVGYGHIKFQYDGEDGKGIVEVFPREPGENEFLVVIRMGEFLDYILISKNLGGIPRYRLMSDGVMSELVCVWNNDTLSVEIVPV